MTRWTLRTGTRSDTVATVSRTDDVGEVLVDAIDPKGEFINFLDSQVGVVAPNKQRNVVELEQIGPGRYRGRFPAAQEGVYLVGMAQRRAEQMVGSQLAGLVVPYGQEFRDLGVDEALLREMSEMTGGGMLSEPKQAFLQNRHKSRLTFDLWPWLVGLVAVHARSRDRSSASRSRHGHTDAGVVQGHAWQWKGRVPDMTAQRRP